MSTIRIALAQINTIVGDLTGNTEKIVFCVDQAVKKQADLIVFPELSITGYPPEDLLLKPHFIEENLKCLSTIAKSTKDILAIVGFVDADRSGIYNSAAILHNKKVVSVYHKINLPNYGVFDEKRYFKSGDRGIFLKARDLSFCINIGEDIWVPDNLVTRELLRQSQLLVNISASPYHVQKHKEKQDVFVKKAKVLKIPIAYCNLVGGQDEVVFDGRSAAFDKSGKLLAQAKAFEEDLLIADVPFDSNKGFGRSTKTRIVKLDYEIKKVKKVLPKHKIRCMEALEEVYLALVLGVCDYVKKNNFKKVAIGLSGGIDSALVASIAVTGLGKANVLAISMPSKYSSRATQDDAGRIAKNLGIRFAKVPIDGIFEMYNNALKPHFTGMSPDITEENLQARIRGNILMAFSNKFGYLVLNTGNKSEASVGYCTLYGDMVGGLAVIKDVPKKLVYKLAEFVNKNNAREVIPKSVSEREPSAELRPNQKDRDVLPPYELLDEIVGLYIEEDRSFNDIVKKIGNKDTVRKVLSMIDANEHKRRQAPPGIKITPRVLGRDRCMPITNKFKEAGYETDDKR
ncbi:MAG: NAD+ synthase [Candidatus Omnitrophica bacterium]|nr:NAD+ synthase [Candidatus Omnitrophota bacterium]